MDLQKLIENHWYKKDKRIPRLTLNAILIPCSSLFFIIVKLRYYMYKLHLFKSSKLPIPVVIIGNITVGGSGKTPLTKHIAQELLKQNIKAGVILRGYKSSTLAATVVKSGDDPKITGDEALIYANNNIPVAIGRNRYHAGLKLLQQYSDIDIILSDDGMQHYGLQRNYEIAVIDASRILGNKYLLPNGPLRESITRLKKVDAIVVNSPKEIPETWFVKNLNTRKTQLNLTQRLVLHRLYNPVTQKNLNICDLAAKSIVAIAAIGNPDRFFEFLENSGIKLDNTVAFPDHYYYQASDIPTNYDIILTSEKDYTKLARFNQDNIYIVDVTSILSTTSLIAQLINKVDHADF